MDFVEIDLGEDSEADQEPVGVLVNDEDSDNGVIVKSKCVSFNESCCNRVCFRIIILLCIIWVMIYLVLLYLFSWKNL